MVIVLLNLFYLRLEALFMSYYRRQFKKNMLLHRSRLRRFLTKVEKNPPELLDNIAVQLDKEVWSETNCLACSNCCREMSPTYTSQDLKRIAGHLGMTIKGFKEKWLFKEKKTGDWMNVNRPCQFLNKIDNKCIIYEVRPADCAEFPHLTKRKMVDYIHIHKQNVQYCPATFKMVAKLMTAIKNI
ncbi:MAG TPA: YkgJ family cysteine cluster protein [Chitinophagaceae bacterium]|nr:YkgJ family cysteine cluster protein [Chitinophagaceae bacterium]